MTFGIEPRYGQGLFTRGVTGYDTEGTTLPILQGEKKLVDMDGDGLADLVTLDRNVFVSLSNGDGSFADAVEYRTSPITASRRFFLADDIDADGDADVLHVDEGAGESRVQVWSNNGDGTLSGPTIYDWDGSLGDPHLADFNGDGRFDLVFGVRRGSGFESGIAISLNQGDGTFGPVAYYEDDNAFLTPLDADGDGDIDVVRLLGDGLYWPNNGDGRFGTPVPIPHLAEVRDIRMIDGFDTDGDGWQDIIVTGKPTIVSSYSNVYLLRGGPTGFAEPERILSGDEISHFTTGDSNGDGLTDLIVSDYDDDSVAVVLAKPRAVCRADLDGDGALTLFDFLTFQNLFDAGDPAADFDGDGDLTIFDFLAFQNAFDAGC